MIIRLFYKSSATAVLQFPRRGVTALLTGRHSFLAATAELCRSSGSAVRSQQECSALAVGVQCLLTMCTTVPPVCYV